MERVISGCFSRGCIKEAMTRSKKAIELGNQPAFPVSEYEHLFPSLTKREYFAGKAMEGMLSFCGIPGMELQDRIRTMSIRMSDQLLEELVKEDKP